MEKRKSFIFCTDWYKPMSALPPMVKLELYDAIEVYVTTGEVPSNLSQLAKIAFRFMKRWIEEENKHLFYCIRGGRPQKKDDVKTSGYSKLKPVVTSEEKPNNNINNDRKERLS